METLHPTRPTPSGDRTSTSGSMAASGSSAPGSSTSGGAGVARPVGAGRGLADRPLAVRLLVAPVSPRAWLATMDAALSLVVGIVLLTYVVVVVSVVASVACTAVLVPVALWLALLGAQAIGAVERARVDALLGTTLANPHPRYEGSFWQRAVQRLISGAGWKELLYSLVAFPLSLIGFVLVIGFWSTAIALVLLPFTLSAMPDDTAHLFGMDITRSQAGIAAGIGLLNLFLAPWMAIGWGRVRIAVARGLLGRDLAAELTERVDTLEASRAFAVDAAEAERRRIERDLHDGAQQRLVALAMNLGMAKEKFDSDPEGARLLLDEAHRDAKSAITELRNLARGIHPVALSDRGLPGAVPALVGRCPIPVDTRVDVPVRPAASIEGIAYFMLSECLTNAVKHAKAKRAVVRVEQVDGLLVVEVSDDGIGGADLALGTGLRGLADRAASVDGTFHVSSPIGGPTVIRAELPCAS